MFQPCNAKPLTYNESGIFQTRYSFTSHSEGKPWVSYLYACLLRDNLTDCSVFNAVILYHVINVYFTVYADY